MKHTIKNPREIQELFSFGKKVKTRGFILIFLHQKQRDQKGRVTFVAGKKLGNAPRRNYAKRLMRHAAQEQGSYWQGYDVLFVARKAIFEMSFSSLCEDFKRGLSEAGIVKTE